MVTNQFGFWFLKILLITLKLLNRNIWSWKKYQFNFMIQKIYTSIFILQKLY
jgi:hypothetical protein